MQVQAFVQLHTKTRTEARTGQRLRLRRVKVKLKAPKLQTFVPFQLI